MGESLALCSHQDLGSIRVVALNLSPSSTTPRFQEQLWEQGIPRAVGSCRHWPMSRAGSAEQLWELAEKCRTPELLSCCGQRERLQLKNIRGGRIPE